MPFRHCFLLSVALPYAAESELKHDFSLALHRCPMGLFHQYRRRRSATAREGTSATYEPADITDILLNFYLPAPVLVLKVPREARHQPRCAPIFGPRCMITRLYATGRVSFIAARLFEVRSSRDDVAADGRESAAQR